MVGGGGVGDLDEVDATGVAVVVDGLQGIENLAALAGFGIIWEEGRQCLQQIYAGVFRKLCSNFCLFRKLKVEIIICISRFGTSPLGQSNSY